MNVNKACLLIPLLTAIAEDAGSITGTVVDATAGLIRDASITLRAPGFDIHVH